MDEDQTPLDDDDASTRPTPWVDDRGKCDGCGKVKDRVIRRLPKPVKLCDNCHEGVK